MASSGSRPTDEHTECRQVVSGERVSRPLDYPGDMTAEAAGYKWTRCECGGALVIVSERQSSGPDTKWREHPVVVAQARCSDDSTHTPYLLDRPGLLIGSQPALF